MKEKHCNHGDENCSIHFMDQNSGLFPVETFVAKNISLKYRIFDAAEVTDSDVFKWGATSLTSFGKSTLSGRRSLQ